MLLTNGIGNIEDVLNLKDKMLIHMENKHFRIATNSEKHFSVY